MKGEETWIPPLDYVWIKTEIYEQRPIEKYAMSLYHSMLILAGNDIGPRRTELVFLTTFLLLCAAIINASIFGNLAVLLQQMNRKSAKLQEKVETASSTMKGLKLPDELQKEIHRYLLYTHNNLEQQNELDIFLSQLSPSLKTQVRTAMLKDALNTNSALEKKSETIDYILSDLSILLFQPEHVIIRQGTPGTNMYFIATGE